MFQTKSKKLYKEFEELLNQGNEGKLEVFLNKNFNKLSDKFQDKVAVVLLKNALTKSIEDNIEENNAIKRFQIEGVKTLRKLENLKKQVQDKKSELKLKESLN